jgi:hypothetical protein
MAWATAHMRMGIDNLYGFTFDRDTHRISLTA